MTIAILRELRSAIEKDDLIGVFSLGDELSDAFDRDRERESRYDAIGISIRYSASVGDDIVETVDAHTEAVITLEQRRIALERSVLGYIGSETATSTVVETIESVIDAYQTLERRQQTLSKAKASVSLPALLAISQISDTDVSVGDSLSVETSVSNLGNESATDLSIELETEMDAEHSPVAINELTSGSTREIMVRVESKRAGTFPVKLRVENDRYSESIPFQITVLDCIGYLERARTFADIGGDFVMNADDRSDRSHRGIGNQLKRIGDQLKRIIARIGQGNRPNHAITNQLQAILNRIDAIENQLKSASSKRANPIFELEITYYLEKITTNIMASIELSSNQDIDDERPTRTERIRPTDAHRTRNDVPRRGRGLRDRVPGNARTPPRRGRGRGFERP